MTADEPIRISADVEEFLRAARARNVQKCHSMLKSNPDLLNSVEAGGYGALHFAAFNGDVALIEMLSQFKPNFELTNFDGNTPLMMAAKGRQRRAIKALVECGASVNFQAPSGATAAHFAASMGDIELVRYLHELGAKILHENNPTGTLLHWAAHGGDVDCVGALIYEFKIPVDVPDAHGGTALFTALHGDKRDVARFLLEHGADPNICIEGCRTTPLHIAAAKDEDTVRLLLAFGAKSDACDRDGERPVDVAKKAGNKDIVSALEASTSERVDRKEEALRFKECGNKKFQEGEVMKATKFYTLAIQLDPHNAVFFSNRAACYFNQRNYTAALWDAYRCLQLAPNWGKAFFRVAATEFAMKKYEKAKKTLAEGLKLDPRNADLLNLEKDIKKMAHAF